MESIEMIVENIHSSPSFDAFNLRKLALELPS